jgi:hypothetical protein
MLFTLFQIVVVLVLRGDLPTLRREDAAVGGADFLDEVDQHGATPLALLSRGFLGRQLAVITEETSTSEREKRKSSSPWPPFP